MRGGGNAWFAACVAGVAGAWASFRQVLPTAWAERQMRMALCVYQKTIAETVVRLSCEEALARQAMQLLLLLEEEQAQEDVLWDGCKLQMGWTMFFVMAADGGFVLCAPDYKGEPLTGRTQDLSLALLVQMQQNDLLRRAGVTGQAVSFQDTVVVLRDALAAHEVYLERSGTHRPGDSGWTVGLLHDEKAAQRTAADYTLVYGWQLLQARPALVKLLALPAGCVAIVCGDEVVEVVDRENRRIL